MICDEKVCFLLHVARASLPFSVAGMEEVEKTRKRVAHPRQLVGRVRLGMAIRLARVAPRCAPGKQREGWRRSCNSGRAGSRIVRSLPC